MCGTASASVVVASLSRARPTTTTTRDGRCVVVSRRGASSRGARLASRALSAQDDTVVVTGALERLAQCAAVRLRENEKSAGVRVVAILPREAFEGVKNPRDVRSKELVYPNANTLDMLRDAGAEPVGEDEEAMRAVLREATCVVFAEETPKKLRATVEAMMARVDAGDAPRLRRVVLLSRIGVERREEDPWKYMNRKTFRGGAPLDDAWAAEEAVRARAARTVKAGGVADGWTYTVVRTGELRGNGPTNVVYGDYALTLVDNAFDVRMQDVEVQNGDTMGSDYTKRLSAAVFANRMLTTSRYDVLNAEFSIISTGPVPRERRKGYDVAKGKSPPPVSDRELDEQLAPGDADGERAPGAVPVPV
jgi:hypothetical protein